MEKLRVGEENDYPFIAKDFSFLTSVICTNLSSRRKLLEVYIRI